MGTSCISCRKWFPFEELDGGHYIPTTTSSTRFDERNIHAQCHRCNRFLHANLRGYFRGLEEKLGRSGLDDLEANATTHKWTREELNAIRDSYKAKLASLRSGIAPEPFLPPLSVSELWSGVSQSESVPGLHGSEPTAPTS